MTDSTTPAPAGPVLMQRKFRMGATLLDDVNPDWTPEQVVAAYTPNFPFLAHATVGEPTVEDTWLVFPIHKPAVQTKGAGPAETVADAVADAERRIAAWAAEPVHQPLNAAAWLPLVQIIDRVTGRDEADAIGIDPLYIPLA